MCFWKSVLCQSIILKKYRISDNLRAIFDIRFQEEEHWDVKHNQSAKGFGNGAPMQQNGK